jgi:hypothetical protein
MYLVLNDNEAGKLTQERWSTALKYDEWEKEDGGRAKKRGKH